MAYLIVRRLLGPRVGVATLLLIPHPDRGWRQRLGLAALLVAGFLLGAAPWLTYKTVVGGLFGSGNYAAVGVRFLGGGNTGRRAEVIEMGELYASPVQMVRAAALPLLVGYLQSLPGNMHQLVMTALWFPGNLLVGGGIASIAHAARPADQARRRWALLAVAMALLTCVLYLSLIVFQARYYVAPMALVIPIAVAFCFDSHIVSHLGKRWLRVALPWMMVVIILVMQANQAARWVSKTYSDTPHLLVPAAAWLADYAEPGDLLLARKPHLGYWAGLRHVDVLPKVKASEDFVTASRELGIRFVLYTSREAIMWSPLELLADPAQAPDGLVLIYSQPEGEVMIYEVAQE